MILYLESRLYDCSYHCSYLDSACCYKRQGRLNPSTLIENLIAQCSVALLARITAEHVAQNLTCKSGCRGALQHRGCLATTCKMHGIHRFQKILMMETSPTPTNPSRPVSSAQVLLQSSLHCHRFPATRTPTWTPTPPLTNHAPTVKCPVLLVHSPLRCSTGPVQTLPLAPAILPPLR